MLKANPNHTVINLSGVPDATSYSPDSDVLEEFGRILDSAQIRGQRRQGLNNRGPSKFKQRLYQIERNLQSAGADSVKAEKWNDELMVAKSALFPFSFHPPLTSLQVNTHSASVGSVAMSEATSPAEAACITALDETAQFEAAPCAVTHSARAHSSLSCVPPRSMLLQTALQSPPQQQRPPQQSTPPQNAPMQSVVRPWLVLAERRMRQCRAQCALLQSAPQQSSPQQSTPLQSASAQSGASVQSGVSAQNVPQSELPSLLPWDHHIIMAHVELERVRRACLVAEAGLLSEMKERVRELRIERSVQESMLRRSMSLLN